MLPLLQAQTLAEALPKLLLDAERLAFAVAPGLHGRRRAGQGDAFWQFRDWQNGDEVRRIDWRRSAQGDRLFFKLREHESQAHIVLVLHESSTLDFKSAAALPSKRERTVLLLLATAALILNGGERVSLAGHTGPLHGPSALPDLAMALLRPGRAAPEEKARRIVFGDFLPPAPAFTGIAGGAVLQILDPAECDFPYSGRVLFETMAGDTGLEAASAEAWRDTYLVRIAAHKAEIARHAAEAGQTPLFHRTDHPPASALAALYQALLRK